MKSVAEARQNVAPMSSDFVIVPPTLAENPSVAEEANPTTREESAFHLFSTSRASSALEIIVALMEIERRFAPKRSFKA